MNTAKEIGTKFYLTIYKFLFRKRYNQKMIDMALEEQERLVSAQQDLLVVDHSDDIEIISSALKKLKNGGY